MRYIIDNKWMDTDTSELITCYEIGSYEYSLYITKKKNFFIRELECHRGGCLGLSCSEDKAIELIKKHSPCSLKIFFPEISSSIEEG